MQPVDWLSLSALFISYYAFAAKQSHYHYGIDAGSFNAVGVYKKTKGEITNESEYVIKNHHETAIFINLPEIFFLVS